MKTNRSNLPPRSRKAIEDEVQRAIDALTAPTRKLIREMESLMQQSATAADDQRSSTDKKLAGDN